MLSAEGHGADIQDRDGAPNVIEEALDGFPTVALFFADGAYAVDRLHCAMLNIDPSPQIEIVRHPEKAIGFVVVARRWVVERPFAWLGINRRLAKYYERFAKTAENFIQISMIKLMTRRLARPL